MSDDNSILNPMNSAEPEGEMGTEGVQPEETETEAEEGSEVMPEGSTEEPTE